MTPDPFRDIVDERTNYTDVADQFKKDRLDRDGLSRADWPSQIDRGATDLLYGVAIGRADSNFDHGGTIGQHDFGRATGEYYVKGLIELVGDRSDLPSLINEHDDTEIGNFVFALTKLRHELAKNDEGEIRDVDRAIEAIVEKLVTRGLGPRTGRQPLHNPEAVVDVVHQLFSDPSASEYADDLLAALDHLRKETGDVDLLSYLDSPQMVTPLWDHQQEALSNWCEAGYAGYVNMATATGKTVLGLGAIAHLFGKLHPRDEDQLPSAERTDSDSNVLVVAGQDLLLEQWQSEFDEHLNIPRDRTRTSEDRKIDLKWGTIEFRTAQDLLNTEVIGGYDLVILDEAHRYRSGSRDGSRWRDLFDTLTERSEAILAMSVSIDQDWLGDDAARDALESNLAECATFTISDARKANVIADFGWEVTYAASVDDETLSGIIESTRPLAEVYDRRDHKFLTTEFDEDLGNVPEAFETLHDLRSFAQSNEGSKARERSDAFDRVATAAFSRRPRRWQLRPPGETVRKLVVRHIDSAKCIVLVQSYEQAEHVSGILREDIGDDVVEVASEGASSQTDLIQSFKERDRGVIVGPGDLIGVGVDIPDADVAINLAKGGVNASLIQRIGRVLRNPSGDHRAHFYQVVTLPATPNARLAGEDGRRLLRRAAEFRALGSRFRELPAFSTVDDDTVPILAELELAGAMATSEDHRPVEEILDDNVAQEWLHELLDAIGKQEKETDPVLPSIWTSETVDPETEPIRTAIHSREQSRKPAGDSPDNGGSPEETIQSECLRLTVTDSNDEPIAGASADISIDDCTFDVETGNEGVAEIDVPEYARRVDVRTEAGGYEPVEMSSLLHGRSGPYELTTELIHRTSTTEKVPENGDTEAVAPSELTELYETFHSFRCAVASLVDATDVEEGPMKEWRDTLETFLDAGLENWEHGYGPQQADQSPISTTDYREQFGNGNRVTEFQVVRTEKPEPVVDALCQKHGDIEGFVVPVTPSADALLPVIVESEDGLSEARSLLTEFPEKPEVGGQPTEADKHDAETDLTTVSGVTEADQRALKDAGFETVADIRDAAYEEIVSLPEIPDHLALRMKADVE